MIRRQKISNFSHLPCTSSKLIGNKRKTELKKLLPLLKICIIYYLAVVGINEMKYCFEKYNFLNAIMFQQLFHLFCITCIVKSHLY